MEHRVCFSCCKTLRQDEEILKCDDCGIWQHFKCTKGVSPSFYLQFYLSVVDDSAAIADWSCPKCTKVEASETMETQKSSLILPEKGHSSHKFNVTLDSTRTSREGPAPDPTTSLASLENRDAPTTRTVFIKPTHLGGKETALTFTATGPASPRVSTTVNKRPHEVLGGSSDESTPAKVHKTSADLSSSINSDSVDYLAIAAVLRDNARLSNEALRTHSRAITNLCDDNLAMTRLCAALCAKLAKCKGCNLDCAPSPELPPSPVDTTATLCAELARDRGLNLDRAPGPEVPPPPVDTTITKLSAKPAKDRGLNLDSAPGSELPPPPVDTTITPLCHSSDSEESHVEPEKSSDITYSLSEGTGKGTKSILTDSHGYTYQIKYKLGTRVFWTCTEKRRCCRATVFQQRKDQLSRGAASHNHGSSQSQTSTDTDSSQWQTSTDTDSTSEGPDEQSQTYASQGPTSEPAVNQSKTRTKPVVNQTSMIKGPTTNNQTPEPTAPAKEVKSTAPAEKVNSTARAKEVKSTAPAMEVKSTAPAKKVNSTARAKEVKSTAPVKEVKSTAPAKKVKSTSPAKEVESTAPAKEVESTAPVKKKAQVKAPTPTLSLRGPANPLICGSCENKVTFQEISTCTRFLNRKQSYLFDPEYHIYETKIEDKEKGTTTWKCKFAGKEGTKCQGMVQLDYIHEFNCPIGIKDYNWTYNHNDHSLIRTQPHNHGPNKATAVDLKIKMFIHQLIFADNMQDIPSKDSTDIIFVAFDMLHDHEKQEVRWDVGRRYTSYVYNKKKEYKAMPASLQLRYKIPS